jgi:hypothetical protein
VAGHRLSDETVFPGEETILEVRRSEPERIRAQVGVNDQQRSSIMGAIIASGVDRAPDKSEPEGSAEVWHQAEQRRADDIGAWLGHLFERRRRLKAANANSAYVAV